MIKKTFHYGFSDGNKRGLTHGKLGDADGFNTQVMGSASSHAFSGGGRRLVGLFSKPLPRYFPVGDL